MRFDLCAHTYDAHAAPQRAFAARVSDFIRPRPTGSVLELGAGTGALTRRLVEKGCASILATDVSAAMVRLGRVAVPAARWQVLDAFSDHIPPSDLQVSSGLLQWADAPLDILRRWRDALPPGRRMVHAFPCDPCLKEWRLLVPASPIQWRHADQWLGLFQQAGLHLSRHEIWTEVVTFRNALDLVRAWHASGVTGHARLRAGDLRRSIKAYDQRFAHPDGVYATWVWLAVEATHS